LDMVPLPQAISLLLNSQARVQSIDTLPETKPSMVYANNEILYLFCH
jgi:hypothetical protein